MATLNRIDNSKAHCKGNVYYCCLSCNCAHKESQLNLKAILNLGSLQRDNSLIEEISDQFNAHANVLKEGQKLRAIFHPFFKILDTMHFIAPTSLDNYMRSWDTTLQKGT